MTQEFLQAFVPLFVAVNIIGILPIFLSLTQGLTPGDKSKLIREATAAAFVLSVVFLFAGKQVFGFLGITTYDFRIGGGVVLMILGISDLVFSHMERRRGTQGEIGVVPIGIPLMIGPAALTTIMIVVDQVGALISLVALVANLLIAAVAFTYSHWILKITGPSGARAFAKVMQLFLIAIAVMMIRSGITHFVTALK